MTDEEKTNLLLEACSKIGSWMSAAIDDEHSCDEFKEALEFWFSALGNFAIYPLDNGIEWPVACGIWGCRRGYQDVLVNCWLKDGEFVVDQIGSSEEREVAREDKHDMENFTPVAIYSPVEAPFFVDQSHELQTKQTKKSSIP